MNICCEKCAVRAGGSGGGLPHCYSPGCRCHQEKPTHEIGWEKEFDDKYDVQYWDDYAEPEEIKSFIKNALTHQKESIVSKLEGMELVEANQLRKSAFGLVEGDAPIFKSAYNAALEDVIDVVRDIDL